MHEQLTSRLLSGRNRPSQIEKEAILEEVLRQAAPAGRGTSRLAAGALVTIGIAASLVMWRSSARRTDGLEPAFAARGAGGRASFRVLCASDLRPGLCRRGDTLLFDVAFTPERGYFTAFARRPDGTVIWYLPDRARSRSVHLEQHSQGGIVDLGIVIGTEHPPGRYEVVGVFTARPASRAEVRSIVTEDAAPPGCAPIVAKRELVIK